eukprot:TRINITY_DN51245_c0_g1_i2.p2 TRINITY_DN51245_c0_g1~~TRINITY_DN51245_c0_g1_i2.p2  ORF type:complete len:124 (+),score=22.58 TRINITY_DN51245_c0_g1_i2:98-469(+)
MVTLVFFFNGTATTEIYTRSIVGSVRCVQETGTWEINSVELTNVTVSMILLLLLKQLVPYLFLFFPVLLALLRYNPRAIPISIQIVHPAVYPPFSDIDIITTCLLYTSPSPRDLSTSRMPSSA